MFQIKPELKQNLFSVVCGPEAQNPPVVFEEARCYLQKKKNGDESSGGTQIVERVCLLIVTVRIVGLPRVTLFL